MISVLLDEDYKSRFWLWEPEMDKEDLIKWWENVDSIEYYYEHLGDLPGKLIELLETDFIDEWETPIRPGSNQTKKISLPENIIEAHICSESDSYLKVNGEYFYHKGVSL